jgi:Xaa-Pro aminopeptidase
VFTGPQAAGAHCGPTDRPIEPGHIMNIDFGVKKNGFCSDIQRTWYFLKEGETEAPEAVKKAFKTITDSIQLCAEKIRPGMTGLEVDTMVRGYITERGYPEYPHATGHQVGRSAHDGAATLAPAWERYGTIPQMKIEEGQVYTIEPRIPVEDYGVATSEEIIVVTRDGGKFLSQAQTELFYVK